MVKFDNKLNNSGLSRKAELGAKAVGFAFGGPKGAQMVSKVLGDSNAKRGINVAKGIAQKSSSKSKDTKLPSKNKRANNLFIPNKWGRNKKTKEEKEKQTEKENMDDVDRDEDENVLENYLSKRLKMKLMIGGAVVIFGIFLLILIVASVFNIFSTTINFSGVNAYGKEDFVSLSQPGTKAYQNELNYYKKLDEIAETYKKKCGIIIDINYIHSILIYKYQDINEFYEEAVIDDSISQNIDYKELSGNISTITDLMVQDCYVDYEVNGEFYNRLKNSTFFKSYYREALSESSSDEILENIFELSSISNEMFNEESDDLYLSKGLEVSVNSGSSSSVVKKVKIDEYIKGSIYADIDSNLINSKNIELIKAYAVVYTTNILSSGKYSPNTISINVENTNEGVLYCNMKTGCSKSGNNSSFYLQDGGSSYPSGGDQYDNNMYYYKAPLSSEKQAIISKAVDDTFGVVLLDEYNSFNQLPVTSIGSVSLGTYENVLEKAYSDYDIANIKEDNYTNNVSYGNNVIRLNVTFYDQNNYANVKFCGRRNATIKSSGCGVVAMAMVSSTLIDKKYTPIVTMNDAYAMRQCGNGISGTNIGFFRLEAKKLGINYSSVSKYGNLNKVTSALASGKSLVIAHMGPGKFTSGGHYIVLGGIDGNSKRVYVYDANNQSNKRNRNSGNGWYSFNDIIAKQAKRFFIFTKG